MRVSAAAAHSDHFEQEYLCEVQTWCFLPLVFQPAFFSCFIIRTNDQFNINPLLKSAGIGTFFILKKNEIYAPKHK